LTPDQPVRKISPVHLVPTTQEPLIAMSSLIDDVSTPLEETTQPPLSPPPLMRTPTMAVARVLELYRLHKKGRISTVGSSWIEVPLLLEEYYELNRILDNYWNIWGYVGGKVW
ncbi:hypothetical protein GP486_005206, partial [Trichoglossum hirsutum]